MAPVTDLGTAVLTGITAAFVTLLSALPSLIGAVLLLAIGWFVSGIVARVVAKALRAARLELAAEKVGVSAFLRRAQIKTDTAGIIAGFVKWYARLVFVLMAAEAVHITSISTVVNSVLAFIPNLIVGVVMVAAFAWLAGIARNASQGALEGAGVANARPISVLAYAATFGFGIVAAATQVGVATTLIEIMFAGLVAAIALAFGLAFGLGGRDEAAEIWSGLRAQAAPMTAIEKTSPNGNGKPAEVTTSNERLSRQAS